MFQQAVIVDIQFVTLEVGSQYHSEQEGTDVVPPEEVEEECPSPKCAPPPIPDRWEGEHIPKAYTLGCGTIFADDFMRRC